MAIIFLSFADEDRETAILLNTVFESLGHTGTFAEGDDVALDVRESADCIVVLWSSNSLAAPSVHEDAYIAFHKECLLPVFTSDLDVDAVPERFRDANYAFCYENSIGEPFGVVHQFEINPY